MSDSAFIVGQRWVSNSEAELGLGIIQESSGRRIEVFFPAAAESRFYAADNAPLSRVIYSEGDKVSTREDVSFVISAVQPFNGCYIYQGDTEAGEPISIHEMDLDSRVHFNQPQDRFFAGQVDKNSQFELRAKTLNYQHELVKSPVYGLLGGRVQLLPHQLYIAQQVAQRFAPRVLLADEVGLGKTIEAGLILHKQVLSGQVRRALIVVPDALLHQWLVEMLRRFNLTFTLIDHERHEALQELDEGNPFDSAQFVLCGLNDLLANPQMQVDMLAAQWDMLIVDEAHHLAWSPEQSSEGYQLIETLAAQIPALLLLTATPEQLGIESHFARLRLLDSDKFFDFDDFVKQEAAYQPVSELIEQLDAAETWAQLSAAQQSQLKDYIDELLFEQLSSEDQFTVAKVDVIQQLLDRHGTGRVLYRNTRDVVKGFPNRILHQYELSLPQALVGEDVSHIILPEQHFTEADWLKNDSRVSWLVDFLKAHRDDKILIICAQADTAQQLENYLNISQGIRSAVFHEGLSLVNRDRAAAYFADDEEGAQCLVCSEIGSEGRNFQFSHHLVLFDLPVNPDLLEQRIGRLDRIGQHHDVHIHVPYYAGTAQSVLLHWYHDGMNAFEQVLAAGQRIAGETKQQLQAAMAEPGNNKALDSLIKQTQKVTEQTLAELQSGRHRLLERHSYNESHAEYVVGEVESLSRSLELAGFMDDVFDAFGVDQQPHSTDSIIIEPGTHMQTQFPELPDEGLMATYQRHKALGREDMTFLTWEHPMVLGAIDMVLNSELGNSAFCTLATDEVKAGSLLLEAIFVMRTVSERDLQIQRFISESHIRLVVDERGRQYQTLFEEQDFNKMAGRIPRATAQELIRHARSPVENLLEQAKKAVVDIEQTLKQEALVNMNNELEQEYQRLSALAKVNPNIRPQELDYLKQRQDKLNSGIQSASLSLDAIRVAIVTEPTN
ncbi:RNA polymerase-associated protein RapA [Methylophaga thalassica]|uniref:RNA polymerase-associated protein RapA n=1 Tax=Methylophaga aminisulfidivorans TaxID=230105 RepID=UPI003A8D5477